MSLRVVIAENDPERRLLFRAHVQTIPKFELVGQAFDAERAVELCDELQPELVVIGVDDDRSIAGAIARLKEGCPEMKVLVVTSPRLDHDPIGADAVLVRPVGSDTFVAALVELAAVSSETS